MGRVRESFENRFHRLVDILYKTQARPHTAAELALHYGMTTRNIQRDLGVLREAHFPLENVGRGRGHRLDPSYRLPQNALSLEELVPLVLGNTMLLTGAQETARTKLRAVSLNGTERTVVAHLPARVIHARSFDGDQWLEPLSAAIAGERCIRARYAFQERVLEPWTLLHRGMVFYVHAYDPVDGRDKRFRLNRFESVEVLPERATVPRQGVELARFHPWDLGDSLPETVVVRVTPELERWLDENPAHPSQLLKGGCAHFQVRNQRRFFGWLLGLYGAKLEQPAAWQPVLVEHIRGLLATYT